MEMHHRQASIASGAHSALEVHLTVVVLWLTQKLAVLLFSTPTFDSFATGSKERPGLWTCLAEICCNSSEAQERNLTQLQTEVFGLPEWPWNG